MSLTLFIANGVGMSLECGCAANRKSDVISGVGGACVGSGGAS